MPVYRLAAEHNAFPPAEGANEDGLVAVGGDLSPQRLLAAYRSGIFPWYSAGEPLLWWSLDPRLVLRPPALHVPRSLKKAIRQGAFRITFDHVFEQVMHQCGAVRAAEGTWITPEMEQAYLRLHQMGFAHSCESWLMDENHRYQLAGGIYGVAIGGAFFGESMFYRQPNASKVALVALVGHLAQQGYSLMDCQMTTQHMLRFGAVEMPRSVFLEDLQQAIAQPIPAGLWQTVSPLI
ncbi:Leucyltransferase [Magnetococcus marinus MC-1]|uniref:Leucyl/phenylalanyl-tRNA--protein transferase n=1 Tax=Magnetococcus marinus (strain ATCC BAA-1437 / JCM 17883 / MC-1) TaxID=156889 RepID=LFTR_MAGMM|nr:leucyl/phenylalanyl-tRNA--protein transferase [Magnetococcus marinus]A0LCQ7.1 RecName: Full=Leucyl/phenylalanyl-tRNA--protein transferase; AltName: Full=L/F-transferase; AltName: Full=Leucyltransferase; AltName: Full=Phenyalanyltransferase [Magnetococcus marinus MC-1]ABK45750.1 Leucyltransferase [Magnetococcus marinus MC-1]